jgi:NTP pyrophosphatase (non-canonical NTP hydrolase)
MAESLNHLTQRLIDFRDERNWRQFQGLKNLIVSLNLEATEMLELTQWKNDDEVENALSNVDFKNKLEEECADVLLYLLMIGERAGIDLVDVASNKIDLNGKKYPIDKSHGNARKYTEF